MNIIDLVETATDKNRFKTLDDFISFAENYLSYIENNLQARIVSQNENHYQFFQYDNWGSYQITRPINSSLFLSKSKFLRSKNKFYKTLGKIQYVKPDDNPTRAMLVSFIYTLQQSIGCALDALPPGGSNKARKFNGDLFEHLVRLIIREIGIPCDSGVVKVPIAEEGMELFSMNYQHDMIIREAGEIKVLGTIKTTTKDRLDKIFVDKFLYSKLTETQTPHIAIVLNDVQRKKYKRENAYGINATFLPGHFRGYTVKLNPLDGVYYCDIRPNMEIGSILKDHIKTIDHLLIEDIWKLV